MSCDTCKDRQTQGTIPGNVFYEMEARNERTIRRLIVAVVLAVLLMFASNALWLYAWQQYDYTSTDIMPTANYLVQFSGNIAIPEDPAGTVEAISLALAVDGEIDPSSIMTVTPAAVGDLWNVSTQIVVVVPWLCRCSSVSVRNISAQPVEVSNANITIEFDGVKR